MFRDDRQVTALSCNSGGVDMRPFGSHDYPFDHPTKIKSTETDIRISECLRLEPSRTSHANNFAMNDIGDLAEKMGEN